MKQGAVLNGRFALRRPIGRGAVASTWLADDRQTRASVVVKVLSFGLLEKWKAFELFEREASVLKNVRHEGIPAFVDFFRCGGRGNLRFALVHEYVPGTNLQEKVESGWRGTEEEIRRIGVRLLGIIEYIHSLRPPLVHRDINPRNIVLRDDGAAFLVDFGGVQDTIRRSSSAGATVIGTPGYTPLEQFAGNATVRSDLYGCAATLLFLLTHRNPQDLPVRDMKVDLSGIDLSPELRVVLDSWLEPDEVRRGLPVETAIELLSGKASAATRDGELDLATPPRLSRIRVEREGDSVVLVIPERGTPGAAPVVGGFSVAWLAFVAFWTVTTVTVGAWVMSLFSIPFWLVGGYLAFNSLRGFFGRTTLRFDSVKGFACDRRFVFEKTLAVPLHEVGKMTVEETGRVNGRPVSSLELEVGARRLAFGRDLSAIEKRWIMEKVNAILRCSAGSTTSGTS